MNALEVVNTKKVQASATRRVFIQADSSGEVPTRIEIVKAGSWPDNSNKGMFYILPTDLEEMKANFDAGIGVPGGSSFGQIPIDFMHNDWDQAAGWITALEITGDTLFAIVEWTAAGLEALAGGMFKCFSPSFYPACLGEWCDPEDWSVTAKNVLVGGGLTNIPFFKDLKPIMASNAGNSSDDNNRNVIYINADKENDRMTLDEVRLKDAASLTEDEKKLLADNKASLSQDELTKFGLVEASSTNKKEGEQMDPQLSQIVAAVKSGESVVVKATQVKAWEKLETDVAELKKEKVQASVESHLARGAIKADQVVTWVGLITADSNMEEVLKNLPSQQVLAGQTGSSTAEETANSASEELTKRARAAVEASAGQLSFGQAQIKITDEDADLRDRLKAEREATAASK